MRARGFLLSLALIGCKADQRGDPEPLDLPANPAESGVPVGVQTLSWGELTVEVWYPASDETRGSPETLDFVQFIPDHVDQALGGVSVPAVPTGAVRDAPLRIPESPYPAVVFSHGFGGNRVQSPDLTVHLASRGYVVVATDHAGRSLADLLPCLFSPPLDGCDLAGFGGLDPGVADVNALVGFVDDLADKGFGKGAIDSDQLGIFGHSAGGGTTSAILDENERFVAGVPMAGAGAIERDVPSLVLAADCDGIVGYDGLVQASLESANADLVTFVGAGHLAFSDLCALDLAGLAEDYLTGRDDVNPTFVDMLLGLGTDGCPGHAPPLPECGSSWLPLETSAPIARHYVTTFFDEHLYGSGPGVEDGVFPEAFVGL